MPVVGPCEKALDQDTTASDQAVHTRLIQPVC